MNTFDFLYNMDGMSLTIEVDFYYTEPDPSADNDWDYSGGLYIDAVRAFHKQKEVFNIDLPIKEIEYQFKKYLEEKEIEFVMEHNASF